MTMQLARMKLVLLAVVVAAIAAVQARASVDPVELNYDIFAEYPDDASASWIHSATLSPINGTAGNGAYFNGDTSSGIAGSMKGDLIGNQLFNVTGSVHGMLKQMSGYLNGLGSGGYVMSTPFQLLLGAAAGGTGALEFSTDGAGGTGPFTGGYLDFALTIGGSSVLDGTLFFKPQAETGSTALSPNRGDAYTFTLWGWNWMHDGLPMDGGVEPDWATFLNELGYVGSTVDRSNLAATLGIALYAVDPPGGSIESAPEPGTCLIWGLLVVMGSVSAARVRHGRRDV